MCTVCCVLYVWCLCDSVYNTHACTYTHAHLSIHLITVVCACTSYICIHQHYSDLESSVNKTMASSLFDLDVKSVNVSVGTPPGMPPPLIPTISDLFASTTTTTTTMTTDQLPGSGGDKKLSTTDTTTDFADFSANFGDTSMGYVIVLNFATHILTPFGFILLRFNNFTCISVHCMSCSSYSNYTGIQGYCITSYC